MDIVERVPGRDRPLDGLRSLRTHRELLVTLVERQVRLRLKRSVMGVLWPMLAPLFLFVLYRYVFGTIFRAPVEDYGIYLFAGLLPWTYLLQTVHDALQSISFELDLVRRAPFPLELLPLSRVVVLAVPFLVLLVSFVAYLGLVADRGLDWSVLPALVVPIAALVCFVAAVSTVLSLVDVYNRDLRYVLHNLFTVWFFLVPIVYDQSMVSDTVRTVTAVDPMRWIIDQFRAVLYDGEFDPVVAGATLAACAGLFVVALACFTRLSTDVAKEV